METYIEAKHAAKILGVEADTLAYVGDIPASKLREFQARLEKHGIDTKPDFDLLGQCESAGSIEAASGEIEFRCTGKITEANADDDGRLSSESVCEILECSDEQLGEYLNAADIYTDGDERILLTDLPALVVAQVRCEAIRPKFNALDFICR